MFAASALAISTVVRSAFGAGFPLFATDMYEKLDPRVASSVLGAIAILSEFIYYLLYGSGINLMVVVSGTDSVCPQTIWRGCPTQVQIRSVKLDVSLSIGKFGSFRFNLIFWHLAPRILHPILMVVVVEHAFLISILLIPFTFCP